MGKTTLGCVACHGFANVVLHGFFSGERQMYWLGVLLASIGASLILGALTFVSSLIGAVITGMIVLMCGPIIDWMIARRRRRS